MLPRVLTVATLVVAVLLGLTEAQNDLDALYDELYGTSSDRGTTAGPPFYTCRGNCVPNHLCGTNKIITEKSDCPSYLGICCEGENRSRYSCGRRNAEGLGFRITGHIDGESEYGEFPWMVAVLREEKISDSTMNVYECGGSLIAPNVVLTAGHCVASKEREIMVVRAGEWDTQTKNERYPHQDRRVREVVIHEKLNTRSLANDIALLILEQPFDLAENVQLACLPPENAEFKGANCFVSGWGKDIYGKEGKYQVILKKVQLPMVGHGRCQAALRTTRLGRLFRLDPSFVCAGGQPGQDTCHGDGGSPLVCPVPGSQNYYYQAGIVAWGIGCGKDGIPGVYVNVPMFRGWIDQQLSQRHVDVKHYTFSG